MATIAAALAALTIAVWGLSIVLMSTSYQLLGVMLAALGLATGVGHAVLGWRITRDSELETQIETRERIHTMPEINTLEAAKPKSVHPIVGHESAFVAWVGFFSTLLLSLMLFSVLTGQWVPPTFTISETVAIGPETYVPLLAMIVYNYQVKVSLQRPDTYFYAVLDLVGSALVFVIAFIGIMSWFPAVSWILEHAHLPLAPFNTLTVVTGFTYLVLSAWDVFWNHWRRSRVFAHNVGPGGELINGILMGNATVGPFTITPDVIVEPVYKVRQPDGSLRTVQPQLLNGPPAS